MGGANDTATGLTDLGVREYQPGSGSFISPDPLLKPYDPQGLNAYAYAEGNPSTYSDPTGAMICDPNGKRGAPQALNTYAPKTTDYIPPRGSSPSPSSDVGNRKVCEIGRGCAPLHVLLTRHDVDDRKPAPVTRKHTSGCGGFDAALRGWQGVCQNITHMKTDNSGWKWLKDNWLIIATLVAAAVCTFVTRGEGAGSICDAGVGAVTDEEAVVVESGKWDYIFGRVASNEHNAARSIQISNQLARIGIYDTSEGRTILQENFSNTVSSGANIVRTFTNKYGTYQIRESLLAGPRGFLKLETTWEVTGNGYRLTTIIPLGGL